MRQMMNVLLAKHARITVLCYPAQTHCAHTSCVNNAWTETVGTIGTLALLALFVVN